MKQSYHTIGKQRKGNEQELAGFLAKNGQILLPMVELIEQCRLACDELIDVTGRAANEAVLRWQIGGSGGAFLDGASAFRRRSRREDRSRDAPRLPGPQPGDDAQAAHHRGPPRWAATRIFAHCPGNVEFVRHCWAHFRWRTCSRNSRRSSCAPWNLQPATIPATRTANSPCFTRRKNSSSSRGGWTITGFP